VQLRITPGFFGSSSGQLLEDDFHQVGANVGDLGKDAAADAEHARDERFTMAKPMKQGRTSSRDRQHQDAES